MGAVVFLILLAAIIYLLNVTVPPVARLMGRFRMPIPRSILVVGSTVLMVLLLLGSGPPIEIGWAILGVGFLVFAWSWVQIFVGLMAQPDSLFPGRYDKLIWVALMVLLPPVGLVAFETYRHAFLTAPKPEVDEVARQFS